MRLVLRLPALVMLLVAASFGQDTTKQTGVQSPDIAAVQKTAVAALNFRQGDIGGFNRARTDFTADGWKDFIKHMEGFLDEKGAPTFSSSFVISRDAAVLDEKDGVVHLRIPGTLTQSNQLGKTTYRAAIELYAARGADTRIKIQHLEQITCVGASTSCN